MLEQQNIQYK